VTASFPEKYYEQQLAKPTSEEHGHDSSLFLKDPRYGLSPALVANFAAVGVNSIYPWQAACLLAPGLLEGQKHLVYTAPTGGGKSLVADVLMLKRIIENPSRKAILVLPYVALVQEKLRWLRRIVQGVEKNINDDDDQAAEVKPYHQRWKKLQKSIRIAGFFGGSKTTATWADTDIAVCTIEKVRYHCMQLDVGALVNMHIPGQLIDKYHYRRM
jgi:DNA polymerase theta